MLVRSRARTLGEQNRHEFFYVSLQLETFPFQEPTYFSFNFPTKKVTPVLIFSNSIIFYVTRHLYSGVERH